MTYPAHFPYGQARFCQNCEALTNAERACPCCTSTRLVCLSDAPAAFLSAVRSLPVPAPGREQPCLTSPAAAERDIDQLALDRTNPSGPVRWGLTPEDLSRLAASGIELIHVEARGLTSASGER